MEPHQFSIKLLKISLLLITTVFASVTGSAQSLGGTSWQGTLASTQNPSLAYPSIVTFHIEGTQLTGSIIMEGQSAKELYVLQGRTQGNQAAGTATYPKDGSVFHFEAQLNGTQMAFVVGLNNTPIMTGTFARIGAGGRAGANPLARTNPATSGQNALNRPDNLPRNNRLVGAWVHSSTYRSGDFHSSTRSFRYFFPDGRLGYRSGEATASLDGADGSGYLNTGSDGVNIEQGVVWYTKGREVWIHVTQQKIPDQKWAEFFINDSGSAMHLNLGKGNILYERTN